MIFQTIENFLSTIWAGQTAHYLRRIDQTVTESTDKKRKDLIYLVERLLEPHQKVEGVVAVGSVASGHARIESDIDVIVFMRPLNRYIIPAESIWSP